MSVVECITEALVERIKKNIPGAAFIATGGGQPRPNSFYVELLGVEYPEEAPLQAAELQVFYRLYYFFLEEAGVPSVVAQARAGSMFLTAVLEGTTFAEQLLLYHQGTEIAALNPQRILFTPAIALEWSLPGGPERRGAVCLELICLYVGSEWI